MNGEILTMASLQCLALSVARASNSKIAWQRIMAFLSAHEIGVCHLPDEVQQLLADLLADIREAEQ